MQKLRPYQEKALDNLREKFQKHKRVLLVAPVGAGKTTIFSEITRRVVVGGKRVLVLVHRKELLDQAAARLHPIPLGLIKAGYRETAASVQVASIQTLRNRVKPPADIVIVDEAHRAKAKTWLEVLNCYPDALVIGFTATPWRLDGKPLGDLFEDMVVACTPTELVDLYRQDPTQGLCPVTGFAYDIPDLSGVKKSGGDYNEAEIEEVMSKSAIVGNIVEQWLKHARELSTVVFAATIAHSQMLAEQFRAAGVAAEHIDGSMSARLREEILARVGSGETRVVCNVNVLTEGTDIPRLKCCVMARPTMSLSLYIQSGGRVRRPWGGLIARIHDHAGNVLKHGLPDEDRDWSLAAPPPREARTRTCKLCYAIVAPGAPCPNGCEAPMEERGPRELNLVAEGEQISLEEVAARRTVSEVQWKRHGQSVSGVYVGKERKPNKWGGESDFHTIRGDKDYIVQDSAGLRGKMGLVKEGETVRLTYVDDVDTGQTYPMKQFKLEKK